MCKDEKVVDEKVVHLVAIRPDQVEQFEREYGGQYRLFDKDELEERPDYARELVEEILNGDGV